MAKWNNSIVTAKGIDLINNTFNNKGIEITKIATSSRKYTSGIENLTSLSSIKSEFLPSSVNIENSKLHVSSVFTNEDVSVDYKLETIGIYARGQGGSEILFAVITASTADTIATSDSNGFVTINFDFYISINTNATFTVNYNSSALLRNTDINTAIDNKIINKANKSEVITDITLENTTLKYKKNNSYNNINLPIATDSSLGLISKDVVKSIIHQFGIGTSNLRSTNIDTANNNGFYTDSINLNGRKNVINFRYENNGTQLAITDSTNPQAFIRSYNNGRYSNWKELLKKEDSHNLENILNNITYNQDNFNLTVTRNNNTSYNLRLLEEATENKPGIIKKYKFMSEERFNNFISNNEYSEEDYFQNLKLKYSLLANNINELVTRDYRIILSNLELFKIVLNYSNLVSDIFGNSNFFNGITDDLTFITALLYNKSVLQNITYEENYITMLVSKEKVLDIIFSDLELMSIVFSNSYASSKIFKHNTLENKFKKKMKESHSFRRFVSTNEFILEGMYSKKIHSTIRNPQNGHIIFIQADQYNNFNGGHLGWLYANATKNSGGIQVNGLNNDDNVARKQKWYYFKETANIIYTWACEGGAWMDYYNLD